MTYTFARVAALVMTALSLAPSYAHVLEAPPRLTVWSPDLWREATVFGGQFRLFAIVGGPVDIAAILLAILLAVLLWRRQPAFASALAGAMLFALGLAAWIVVVAQANSVLATWQPGPIPDEFFAIRNRWETGHMIVAALKFLGFIAVAIGAVTADRRPEPNP
jgi:hypothetical protein